MSYSDNSFNPAWSEVLEQLPIEYHEKVTPHLQKWDSSVNERFNKIHNEYSDFKQFKEAGYNAEQIDFALGVARAMQDRPDEIFNALGEYHGYFDEDDDQEDEYDAETVAGYDPRVDTLEEGYNLLAEAWLRDQRAKQEHSEDAALDAELEVMYDKYGDFNEEFVLTQMAARGLDTEDAVREWFELEDQIISSRNRRPAPRVFGSSGGGIPQMHKPNLSDARSRKEYGAAILQSYFGNR